MWDTFFFLFVVAALAGAVVVGALFVRGYLGKSSALAGLFAPKAGRRIAVVEQANVDGRRRLVLIRRDDVEHLIMTGGPMDLVIESGIGARGGATGEASPALFPRPARALGQAVGDR